MFFSRGRIAAQVAFSVLTLGMGACGGGGGGTSGGTTPPPVTPPAVASVTVTPNTATATLGGTVQFSATVAGSAVTDPTVKWTVTAAAGDVNSPGSIDAKGFYTTPFPAPATVTVTATSNQNASVSGSATLTLQPPATASGPTLTVDTSNQTHVINPFIYGMNAFSQSVDTGKAARITVDRWGGDATSRYNYKLDVSSAASDWYFENGKGATGLQDTGSFNQQVSSDIAIGAKTIGTVPVLGWVAKDSTSCSFPVSLYPNQNSVDPYSKQCGDGLTPDKKAITGIDPKLTSIAIDGPTWAGEWVKYLVSKFGAATSGGVAIYDLDNEPTWWNAVHRDVHPVPFTYDEVTDNGIAVAKAIKAADPGAEVSGPVLDNWWSYFYSKKDMESGWGSGPCYQPWSGPTDRDAHGGMPMIEYYLQQFAAAEKTEGKRLLDYLDLHAYFVANDLGFKPAGDTTAQQARLNSTRVFWDSTYTDPNFPQPNYKTDASFHNSDCNVPVQAPQVIPMMKKWVAARYPGTKLAITEYNWGGQEHINGALAQADILGIFGREGLDIGTLWGAPDATKQIPGLVAFQIFRDYDGKKSEFGEMAVSSTSADQGKLSIYGALRTADHMVTLVVINKTYGDLSTSIAVKGLPPSTLSARAYLYSKANLNAIVAQPSVAVKPGLGGAASTIAGSFPAQSITVLEMQN